MTHPYELSSIAVSDMGLRRKNNEDSTIVLPRFSVFAVADGMGGAEAGEVASDKVVKFIENALRTAEGAEDGTVAQKCRVVTKALKEASDWIWRYAREQNLRSCGTTVVTLVFDARGGERAMVLHAGDSRAYRFRGGLLEQVTRDHSFAEASGIADVKLLPARLQGVITRAVGISQSVGIEETPVSVAPGDVFLLCSDGLSSMVNNFKIQEILRASAGAPLEQIAKLLIAEANRNGGNDNVSVVLVRADPIGAVTLGVDPPLSNGSDGAALQTGTMPSRTVTIPQDLATKTEPRGDASDFELRPVPFSMGFSTVVRLGLGLIAILLLVLVLLTIVARRRAVVEVTKQRVERVERKRPGEASEQYVAPALPPMMGEEPGPGVPGGAPAEDGVVPIPADPDVMPQPDPAAIPESPSSFGPGVVTNEPFANGL